jgi:hypothetical protein
MPQVQLRFEGYLIRETAGWLLGTPPPYIAMEDHECCYIECPEEGTIHIGANGGDSHWICFRHPEKWNADRDRFLADGGGCEMQRLGELLDERCAQICLVDSSMRCGVINTALPSSWLKRWSARPR